METSEPNATINWAEMSDDEDALNLTPGQGAETPPQQPTDNVRCFTALTQGANKDTRARFVKQQMEMMVEFDAAWEQFRRKPIDPNGRCEYSLLKYNLNAKGVSGFKTEHMLYGWGNGGLNAIRGLGVTPFLEQLAGRTAPFRLQPMKRGGTVHLIVTWPNGGPTGLGPARNADSGLAANSRPGAGRGRTVVGMPRNSGESRTQNAHQAPARRARRSRRNSTSGPQRPPRTEARPQPPEPAREFAHRQADFPSLEVKTILPRPAPELHALNLCDSGGSPECDRNACNPPANTEAPKEKQAPTKKKPNRFNGIEVTDELSAYT